MLKKNNYRQINSKPVRSPSPDYMAGRNGRTLMEAHSPNLTLICKPCAPPSASQFPLLPIQAIGRKRKGGEEENINPTYLSPVSKSGARTKPTLNKPVSAKKETVQIPNISSFQASIVGEESLETDWTHLLQELSHVYSMLPQAPFVPEKTQTGPQLSRYMLMLAVLKERVALWTERREADQTGKKSSCLDSPQFRHLERSPTDSPISGSQVEESDLSFFQTGESVAQEEDFNPCSASHQPQWRPIPTLLKPSPACQPMLQVQGQGQSLSVQGLLQRNSFLQEKVSLLEAELEDKISKVMELERAKNEEILKLRGKISNSELKKESYLESSRRTIQELQDKITLLAPSSDEKEYSVNVHIFNSDKKSTRKKSDNEIIPFPRNNTGSGYNRKSERKGLAWDREEIVSVYDKEKHPDEDIYSEAERVDVDNYFKNQGLDSHIGMIREQYQQALALMDNKYRSHLQSVREELRQMKEFILQFADEDHGHLQLARREVLLDQMERLEMKGHLQLAQKQAQLEKQQNSELRKLIHKIHGFSSKPISTKKGALRMNKSLIASENIREAMDTWDI